MPWFRRRHSPTQRIASPITPQSEHVAGKRFLKNVPYSLPADFSEVSRLDFQHWMLFNATRTNYFAPIYDESIYPPRYPDRILDVGSGTGIWLEQMHFQFPDAQLHGIDIQAPSRSPNDYTFHQANILDFPWSFPSDFFDYGHQRLLVAATPMSLWERELRELFRVIKPGGLVELVESGFSMNNGPALQQINDWCALANAERGVDINQIQFLDSKALNAGFRNITVRTISLPIGHHGVPAPKTGTPQRSTSFDDIAQQRRLDLQARTGAAMASDYFTAVAGMRNLVTEKYAVTTGARFDAAFQEAQNEVKSERNAAFSAWQITIGQKP